MSEKQRTDQQNKALHVLFANLSAHLNAKKLDMRTVLKETFDIPWHSESVRRYLVFPALLWDYAPKVRLTTTAKFVAYERITEMLADKGMSEPFPKLSVAFGWTDFLELVAERLNDAGWEMRAMLPRNIKVDWTPLYVKEYLWKPVQELVVGKEHTADLTTKEIDKVYDVVIRQLASRHGVVEPFPSFEEILVTKRKYL